MKFIQALSVATLIALSSSVFAEEANSFNVQFERGTDHASLVGTVRGKDYDSYTFRANKGQILSLQAHDSDVQIQTALFYKGDSISMTGNTVRLPNSGEYQLRVMKSHADSMNNTVRQYNITLIIRNDSKTPAPAKKSNNQRKSGVKVSYLCDGNGSIQVNYVDIDGKAPKATVQYKGHSYSLSYDWRFSTKDELMVFTGGKFSINLDRSQTKDLSLAEVIAFNQEVKGNARVVVQNCIPQK